jgi:myo-inositol 2-dehydrogenase/D-chiro-inositol 1-dehydrogenase
MRQTAQTSGAPLQLGFVRRFDDEWLAFRDAIQAGKLGGPVVWRDVQSHAGPWQTLWYHQDEQGGGPFLDGCIHNLDFALFLFGPAEWVFTHGRTLREGSTAIDTGTATVHFASGDELLLAWSWGLPPDTSGGRVFEFLGPQGTLTWPRDTPRARFVIHTGGEARENVPFPSDALTQAFARQVDEFLAVAQGKARPRAGADEGVAALDVALAILESGRTRQPVRVE